MLKLFDKRNKKLWIERVENSRNCYFKEKISISIFIVYVYISEYIYLLLFPKPTDQATVPDMNYVNSDTRGARDMWRSPMSRQHTPAPSTVHISIHGTVPP